MIREWRAEGLSKREIKEKLIRETVERYTEDELQPGEQKPVRTAALEGNIYHRLKEADALVGEQSVPGTVPDWRDIERFFSNNPDMGFLTVEETDFNKTWILRRPERDGPGHKG